MKRWRVPFVALAALLGLLATSQPAAAWDPSSTHQGLLEAGVVRSALHLRWMDASELQRGLFSPVRLDPDRLDREQRRLLELTIRRAHADVGALPLGGPGACPPADAPADTQAYCVDQDLWEHSALGWLRLGMRAEVTPTARHAHHVLDREQFEAERWQDRRLPAAVLRARQARSNGAPRAGAVAGTNFGGDGPSALAWLSDPDDPLAPTQTYDHLERASTSPSLADRQHHLALGLMGVGALLHVVQDLSVPAHARGDATAFFARLSTAPGDRGLPLQEFVRVAFGRHDLPGLEAGLPDEPPSGQPLAGTVRDHLLGDASYTGLARLARGRFFSEASVPAAAFLDDTLSASEAATALLGDDHGLDPVEVDGAVLSPWPAGRGYLLSPTGRALAAFDTDRDGRIRPYLDETCYRDISTILLPAAVDVTRSLLDLLWPAWPQSERSGSKLTLTPPAEGWATAAAKVFIEGSDGTRRPVGEQALELGTANQLALGAELAAGERHVVVLLATREQGPPIVLEHWFGSATSETNSGTDSEATASQPDDEAGAGPGEADDAEGQAPAEGGTEPGEDGAVDPVDEPGTGEPQGDEPAAAPGDTGEVSGQPEADSTGEDGAAEDKAPAAPAQDADAPVDDVPTEDAPLDDAPAQASGADQVSATIRKRRSHLQLCYEQGLKQHPELKGTMGYKLTISPSGRVTKVVVEVDKVGDSTVRSCTIDAIKKWRFSVKGVDAPSDLRFSVNFLPDQTRIDKVGDSTS